MLTIDSHCDTPSKILRGRDISADGKDAHVDVPKLRRSCVDASFFALYTPADIEGDSATSYALEMLSATMDAIEANSDFLSLATCADDIVRNKEKGLFSVLLGMENASPVKKSLSLLRQFYRLGVRYLTLTHNGDNEVADAASHGKRWNGLSPFGRELVAEMNRIGMIIDLAHASDKTFYDVLESSSRPVVSTHSCCRALASHRRNMTDDMIRRMADKGGLIQINFYPLFLSDSIDPVPGLREIVDHIDHAVKVGGIEHVGIGSDFDGIEIAPQGVEDISKMNLVFEEMSRRGYASADIEKVAGLNLLRVLADAK